MKFLDKLECKFGKYYIKNLMAYIIGLNAIVYIMMYTSMGQGTVNNLVLVPDLVLKGEVWRLITFIFVPPSSSIIFIAFVLYLYYLAGTTLENYWGGFKFNVYYLIGILSTILISFITDTPATSAYINLSLFLAFARIAPEFPMLIFFIIPAKAKHLAVLNWIFIIYNLIFAGSLGERLLVLAPVINYLIFFGKDILTRSVSSTKNYQRQREFDKKIKPTEYRHKCVVCGVTEIEDPNMEFRYCSKCSGNKCYCINHIKNHKHT